MKNNKVEYWLQTYGCGALLSKGFLVNGLKDGYWEWYGFESLEDVIVTKEYYI